MVLHSNLPGFGRQVQARKFQAPALLALCSVTSEGRAVVLEASLLVERPAQAARTHNPTPIHLSSGLP